MRKRECFAAFLAFVALLLPVTVFAYERVSTFVARIVINTDGTFDVQEEIVFDFEERERHGIIREIPLMLPASERAPARLAEISGVAVTDGRGNPREVTYNTTGNMATLRIGDPVALVSGPQLYVIRYKVSGAINPTLLDERFFWNVTGFDWKVPLERVRVDVVLPLPLFLSGDAFSCRVGERDSLGACTDARVHAVDTEGRMHTLRFEQTDLGRFEGMTISLVLPKGSVFYSGDREVLLSERTERTSLIVRWWAKPFIDASLALPFFVFAGLYGLHVSGGKGRRSVSAVKRGILPTEASFSNREAYLLSGIALLGLSFFVSGWNLGILLSGIVFFAFGFFPPAKRK